jgi:hypothetical protein
MTENFDSFKDALKSGLSPEEAAFHTFTGHMAAKWGFTHATVMLNNDDKVIVEFRRYVAAHGSRGNMDFISRRLYPVMCVERGFCLPR